jgi:Flp pilus assembly protein TadD
MAATAWLLVVWRRNGRAWQGAIGGALLVALGFALLTAPVATWSGNVTGRTSPLPASGGINLYVGNNPDAAETVGLRPGSGWRELTRSPRMAGVEDRKDTSRYFTGQFLDYVRGEPDAFLAGLGSKAFQLASSRELPRNVDLYVHRAWSRLLSGSTWKLAGFGFPFGVLLPLAFVGIALHWRRLPGPLLLFVALYGSAVVLVFVSARYRAPMIPALAVAAAAGAFGLVELARHRRFRQLAAAAALFVTVALVATLPGPFPQERADYEAEMYYLLARNAQSADDLDLAVRHLTRAIELEPTHSDAHNTIGTIHARRRELPAARRHLELAVRHNPRSVIAIDNLARILAAQGEMEAAASTFDDALAIEPYNAAVLRRSAVVLMRLRRNDEAERRLRDALRSASADPRTYTDLARLLNGENRRDEAVEVLRAGLAARPSDREIVGALGDTLVSAGRRDEAIAMYRAEYRRATSSRRTALATEIERRLKGLGQTP